jgi:hypothetical protein
MKIIERIHDVETDQVIDAEREMTADEIILWEADKLDAETKLAAQAAKESQKAALLEKLGITADEAALLLS